MFVDIVEFFVLNNRDVELDKVVEYGFEYFWRYFSEVNKCE